jgi:hypothetical protein
MNTKLRIKSETTKELTVKHQELMQQYRAIVFPYGLGYTIPDDLNEKATRILEQAELIRAEISANEPEKETTKIKCQI